MHDIVSFDLELGNTLQELKGIVLRKQYLESSGSYDPELLRFRGASIEDLCLDFSVPGYPEYVLKPGNDIVCNILCLPLTSLPTTHLPSDLLHLIFF